MTSCKTGFCNTCRACFAPNPEETDVSAKRKIELKEAPPAHSVHTDALATLGTIIDDKQGRDAIHLAVEPVEAAEQLYAGQHVVLKDGKAYGAARGRTGSIGIVDPFLAETVFPGQRFWLVVHPRTITSLRHVWEHPAFPTPITVDHEEEARVRQVEAARIWIEDWAQSLGVGYFDLMRIAGRDFGSPYIQSGDLDLHGVVPPRFWDCYEIVTGTKVPRESRAEYFTCSC